MIPIRLSLRNFMCYRENVPVLSFAGIHTACICGDNGNGKSALIDAITWALWGKARAKSDIDLIAQGQSEMSVEFDFAIGGRTFRVIRKYARPKTRTGSGHPVLEFQAATDGGFKSISGNTLSQTEQQIRDELHMDYETFINSVFLRQGHADEFTNKRPGERKDVLANILGLAQYDEYERKARETMRTWEESADRLQVAIEEYSHELEQKSGYEAELQHRQGELLDINSRVQTQESRVLGFKTELKLLEDKKQRLTELEKQVNLTQSSLESWSTLAQSHAVKINEYNTLLANCIDTEGGFARLVTARNLNQELNGKLSSLLKMNEKKSRLERAIDKAKNELLQEQAVIRHKINELNLKAAKMSYLKESLKQLEVRQDKLTADEVELEKKKKEAQELRVGVTGLETKSVQLKSEIEELNKKLALLATENGAKCPLCEQELGIEEHRKIDIKYNEEKINNSRLLESTQAELAAGKNKLLKIDREITQSESSLKQARASLQGQISLVQKSISEATEAINNVENENKVLINIEERLTKQDFAFEEQREKIVLETAIISLGYDTAKHEEVKHKLVDLERYEEPKRKLDEADKNISSEREALERAERESSEQKNRLLTLRQQCIELKQELRLLPQLEADLEKAQNEYSSSLLLQKEAQEIVGRVKEKLQHCIELENKKAEKEKEMDEAQLQAKIYDDLSQAFGKRGIQAMLIEMAVPEIEMEADRLLAKMTDNRMHIKIETQRPTKAGDVAETLDINVSDELGTRSYEMFSGGEAFRINFAIRIALSRLLAQRAGAPLRTLIIDEGFGTQDEYGIEKLKEAINSIQDDFDKVLVITHIDELKDAFPTRIDVVKTAEGSTITLN